MKQKSDRAGAAVWAADNIKPKISGFTDVAGSLFLITAPPISVHLLAHTLLKLDGSWNKLGKMVTDVGIVQTFSQAVPSSEEVWRAVPFVLSFAAFQLLLMWVVPGKYVDGPVAPSGHVPKYKANGVQCFLLTILVWAVGSYQGLIPAGWQYDHANGMFAFLNVSSICLCMLLYLKGRFLPSTADSGHSGNLIFDFFWGTELYPRFGHWIWPIGWDVKLFTNCRFGMMYWGISTLSYAAKQYELHGFVSDSMLVSSLVQVVYVLKFFWWEMGYMNTMDIQHDRAGFYICWGCLVWVPSLYTCHTLFLVNNPYTMGRTVTALLLLFGLLGVWINYESDAQKMRFRRSGGKCLIWGKPAKKIVASYTTKDGVKKESLLLLSGWWGVSRHFHYIPELMAAFAWTAPTLWEGSWAGFSYWLFLACLLTDRSMRDDTRCRIKYGESWSKYCELVPYKIIPYIF